MSTTTTEYDVVVRGGTVVDGTGRDGYRADVGIRGDRVAALGEVRGSGRREIDAAGSIVTPGFVDIHTHLDAQLAWDPVLSSSCWHGVTSVVLGNCGVTFAPCKPADRGYLANLMQSVEDIPADSIMAGLDWSWETYGDYLDALAGMPKGLNVGGMVGHCALRYYAMGERSLSPEPASDADIGAMCELLAEAVGRGAIGFSTSRTPLHRVPDGRLVPGTYADRRELVALARTLGEHDRGVFEAVPSFVGDPEHVHAELEILEAVSREGGRPVTFALTQMREAPRQYAEILAAVAEARERGALLFPQTTAKSIGLLYGIVHRTPFDRAPGWRALRSLPLGEKLAELRSPSRRRELIAEAEAFPPAVSPWETFVIDGDVPRYDNDPATALAAIAERRGVAPVEAFIDLSLEQEGAMLMTWPILNSDLEAVEDLLTSPVTIMGLADAGAHVGMIMDASQPTHFLANWARDRGVVTVPEAVRKLTSEPADLFGLPGRGRLEVGSFADLNVVDLDALALEPAEYVHDFPLDAGRFVQRSRGYRCTLVNGEVFLEDGEHTGALAGTMLC